MFLLRRKEKSVFAKLNKYLDQLDVCKDHFIICITELINRGVNEREKEHVANVHKAESRADDLRREIECDLYNKALIPELRGDVLGILETVDSIPSCFQSICFHISLQQIEIPRTLIPLHHHLIKVNLEAYLLLNKAIRGFFLNKEIFHEIQEIDDKESESDRVERELIERIFSSAMEKVDKILLREIVEKVGGISDQSQVVADRLTLAVIKRRI
jgi:predicted phosphate transport protein (TIGR00153 family)